MLSCFVNGLCTRTYTYIVLLIEICTCLHTLARELIIILVNYKFSSVRYSCLKYIVINVLFKFIIIMLLVLIIIYLQSQNNTVYVGLTADGDDSILFPLSSYLLLTGDQRYPEGFALSLSLTLYSSSYLLF